MNSIAKTAIFLEVVRQQGFANAGRVLGMSGSAVSKQVQNLEDELGVKLLYRTTRKIGLTEEGELYFERAARALDELNEAKSLLLDRKAKPAGVLKISVPYSFGIQFLQPTLAGFAAAYPDIVMDVAFEDRHVDVVGEGFDAVVRIGALADSALLVKKLADCPMVPCASPRYIEAHGAPKKPEDLAAHRMICFTRHGSGTEWRWQHAKSGRQGVANFTPAFKSNTAEMMRAAAMEGIGVTLLPIFMVATHIKAGGLVRVLPGYDSNPPREIVILYPPGRNMSTKVRLFLDWMGKACKALPW